MDPVSLGSQTQVALPWYFLAATSQTSGTLYHYLYYCFEDNKNDCAYSSSSTTLQSDSMYMYSYTQLDPLFKYTWSVPSTLSDIAQYSSSSVSMRLCLTAGPYYSGSSAKYNSDFICTDPFTVS